MLALDEQLQNGQDYTFHFSYGGLQSGAWTDRIISVVSADSNFGNPSAATKSLGPVSSNDLAIHFTYQGCGSNVGDAAGEMLSVINSGWFVTDIGTNLKFESASSSYVAPGTDTPRTAGDTALASVTSGAAWILVGLVALVLIVAVGAREI